MCHVVKNTNSKRSNSISDTTSKWGDGVPISQLYEIRICNIYVYIYIAPYLIQAMHDGRNCTLGTPSTKYTIKLLQVFYSTCIILQAWIQSDWWSDTVIYKHMDATIAPYHNMTVSIWTGNDIIFNNISVWTDYMMRKVLKHRCEYYV